MYLLPVLPLRTAVTVAPPNQLQYVQTSSDAHTPQLGGCADLPQNSNKQVKFRMLMLSAPCAIMDRLAIGEKNNCVE